MLDLKDGDYGTSSDFLSTMFSSLGDEVSIDNYLDDHELVIRHTGLRICRGIFGLERDDLLSCWSALWLGAIHSQQKMKIVSVSQENDALVWKIKNRG